MVHGAMLAVHSAAATEAKKKLVDAFRIRGATAPERALPLPELELTSDDRGLGDLISSGVIRGVDPRGRPTVIGYEEARVAAYISMRAPTSSSGTAASDRKRVPW